MRLTPLILIAGSLYLAPVVAQACSCAPSASLMTPDDGELAADEALLFNVFCSTVDETVRLLLDGAPVEWTQDIEMSAGWTAALRPNAVLSPGQVLTVQTCADFDCQLPESFEDVASFTVTQAAARDPQPVLNVVLTHDEGNFTLGCFDEADVRFDLDVALPDFSPAVYRVDIDADDGSEATFHNIYLADGSQDSFSLEFHAIKKTLGADPGAYCATVTAYDLSGRVSPAVTACDSSDGCSCRAGGELPGAAWLMLLPLVRRRRR